jgi:WXG100 family type VII secretion target
MGYFKVTSEELQAVSVQLTNFSGQVQTLNQQALGSVQNLTSAGWQGASSATFQAHVESWQQSAQNIQHQLEILAQKLSAAAAKYQATEDEVRASV